MSSIPHPTRCDPSECRTDKDGQIVHHSAGEAFELNTNRPWTASMLTVQFVDNGEGMEVGLIVEDAAMRSSVTLLPPDVAAELGEALLDQAQRAGAPAQDGTAALLAALEDVSITDGRQIAVWRDERHPTRNTGGGRSLCSATADLRKRDPVAGSVASPQGAATASERGFRVSGRATLYTNMIV